MKQNEKDSIKFILTEEFLREIERQPLETDDAKNKEILGERTLDSIQIIKELKKKKNKEK